MDLEFGMYIADLDRPWTDTPFIFQGFLLQTAEQLEILKDYCSIVFVDPDRREVISRLPETTIPPRTKAKVDLSRSGKFRWTELLSVEKEYAGAAGGYAVGYVTILECVVALRSGKTLPADKLSEAVNAITESVLRNPDAMLLFSQLQDVGGYTQSHALDTSIYMAVFGRFLGMSAEDISLLGYLGLLQDIGKVKLPTVLIEKRGRLTPIEYQLAQKHIQYSAEVLRASAGLPRGLADLAMLHHERVDGSGYPRGLKGKEIGLMGSIAAIVDTFDALTAQRPYAAAMSPSDALKLLYKSRGSLFDTYLVEQFIRCIGIFPLGSIVELNGGEIGIVIAQNQTKRLQPRIVVIQDADGNSLKPQKLVDLARGPKAPDGNPYRIKRTLQYSNVPLKAGDLFLSR